MQTSKTLFRQCVYTIVNAETLDGIKQSGGSGTVLEKKPWTTAKRLLGEAREEDCWMPIVFADAKDVRHLIYYANLQTIELNHDRSTTYSFSGLTQIVPLIRKNSLRLASSGKRLDPNFIRPYALCFAPPFLKRQVSPNGEEMPDLSRLVRENADIKTIEERKDIGPTEKKRLIKARLGQGEFRSNVQRHEKACRVTGVSTPDHLIASHIKPWSK